MKKARTVTIPDDRRVDFKTYTKLNDHAYKSALYYATTYNKNTYQIREKLYDKGYVQDEVIVVYKDGHEERYNIVDETIDKLVAQYISDDYQYTVDFLNNGISSGKSVQSLKTKLVMNKIPPDMISEAIESGDVETDDSYGLDKQAHKIVNSSSFDKLDRFKRQQKLLRSLSSKGFSIPEIYEWMNDHSDDIDE